MRLSLRSFRYQATKILILYSATAGQLAGCSAASGVPEAQERAAADLAGENAAGFGAATPDLDTDTSRDEGAEPEAPRAIELLDRARRGVSGELEAGHTAQLFEAKQGRDDRFVRELDELRTLGEDRHVEVALPVSARGAFTIREKTSGLAAHVRFESASDVAVAVAEGHAVYDSAVANGAHVVQRPIEGGLEDYVYFEQRPAEAEIRYVLDVSDGVAGLRLVSNTLELIDEQGTPRLRVSPPFLIDRRAKLIAARLEVEGCAYDDNAAGPWDRAPTPTGAKECTVVVRWDDDAVEYPAALDPAWTATGNLSFGRLRASATVLANGRVLFAGGCSNNTVAGSGGLPFRICTDWIESAGDDPFYPAPAELFDPATATFSITGSLSQPREKHAAVLLPSGEVFIAGGRQISSDLLITSYASVERYNPSTGLWTSGGALLNSRAFLTATNLPNGRVLIVGQGTATEVYNPATNSSAASGPVQVSRSQHVAVALNDGRVLIVGGGSSVAQKTYELYSSTSGTFTAYTHADAPPQGLTRHAGVKLSDGRVLVVGGWHSGSNPDRGATHLYDPATNTWLRVGSTARPRDGWPALAALPGGLALVTGGGIGTTSAGITPELFNVAAGTWGPLPALRDVRAQHSAIVLANNTVLVAGGLLPEADGAVPRNAYTYNPALPAITSAEYRLLPNQTAELWASLHRPAVLEAGKRYPLVVLVHGRNPPCTNGAFTTPNGPCPAGGTEISHHRGFDYLSEELARRGYFALSINWNRFYASTLQDDAPLPNGVVNSHLGKLQQWDSGAEATPASLGVNLANRFDFSQIALAGHSRGGATVVTTYNTTTWPAGWNVRGIFTIGSAEQGRYVERLNLVNTKFIEFVGTCDIESTGVWAFDRLTRTTESTAAFKATYVVHGAGHNFYNTLWTSQSNTCSSGQELLFSPTDTGSARQRQTAVTALLHFVLGNVGATPDPTYNQLFDPRYPVLSGPRVDRGYLDGANNNVSIKLEEFTSPTGTSSRGFANVTTNVTAVHRDHCDPPSLTDMYVHESGDGCTPLGHDNTRTHWAHISWTSANPPNRYFQSNWAAAGQGVNLSGYQTIDLRIDRGTSALNPATPTNFEVRLVKADGSTTGAVSINNYVTLSGPVGSTVRNSSFLQTARIPLSAFTNVTPSSVRGIRLTFPSNTTGSIYVANIRASKPAP